MIGIVQSIIRLESKGWGADTPNNIRGSGLQSFSVRASLYLHLPSVYSYRPFVPPSVVSNAVSD